jgi:hypothetical protein
MVSVRVQVPVIGLRYAVVRLDSCRHGCLSDHRNASVQLKDRHIESIEECDPNVEDVQVEETDQTRSLKTSQDIKPTTKHLRHNRFSEAKTNICVTSVQT